MDSVSPVAAGWTDNTETQKFGPVFKMFGVKSGYLLGVLIALTIITIGATVYCQLKCLTLWFPSALAPPRASPSVKHRGKQRRGA